ncbi:long-chain-fatty-acid--CoA ligase [Actinocorallia populi]|uniref:long-chain-fatty-acid--CoA ligase n=1 Tax=Actinocorallia populi TaxID=2079200 RepID=UPI000D08D87A|nr:long-chain-fatty-acid--CoA ligase [Actinocorallia populi]
MSVSGWSGAHWSDHVARHAHTRPDGVALRFEGASTTWAELDRRVRALAGGLHARGVRQGDRVAVLMTNRPEFVETVVAANLLGAIAVPVNFRLSAAEAAYIVADSGARMLVADGGLAPLAAAVRSMGDLEPACLVTGESPIDAERYEAVLAEGAEPPSVPVGERDTALIMYTSGTTGRPKGAMLSHLNLLMQSFTLVRAWRLFGDDEVNLCASPLFHIGAIGSVAPMLMVGATTVIMPSGQFDAAATLGLIEAERVTSAFLVPAQWQVLCAEPSAPHRARSLRTISWGAAPATVTLLERMAEVFPHAANVAVFGQTEMSPVTCALEAADALRKIGSVGRPVATVAARIVDAAMKDVAPGEVGEIVYRGPSTMSGYWNAPEATAEAFEGGWFHSGDLVRADEEGFLYVVDRKKDMIISGGENIYCAEVENVLAAHPDVAEVAVVGVPHEKWGETPLAVIVPAAGRRAPTAPELAGWCRDRLASYKKPTAVAVVAELPRNASGKVLKHELRAAHSG